MMGKIGQYFYHIHHKMHNIFSHHHSHGENVNIQTGSQDDNINIDDTNGDVHVRSGSSDDKVVVDDTWGNVHIKSGSGDDHVDVDDTKGNVWVKSGSGDDHLIVDDTGGNVHIKSYSGDDDICVSDTECDVNIHSGSGDDQVYIDDTESNVWVKSGSGDDQLKITNTQGDVWTDGGSGDDKIKIIDTDGNVDAKGRSGDDHIYIKDVDGNVHVNAGSGDDYVKVDDVSGSSHIKGGSGDDHLKGGSQDDFIKAGSGDDFFDGGEGSDHAYGESGDDIGYFDHNKAESNDFDVYDGGSGYCDKLIIDLRNMSFDDLQALGFVSFAVYKEAIEAYFNQAINKMVDFSQMQTGAFNLFAKDFEQIMVLFDDNEPENLPPNVSLDNIITELPENTDTMTRIKVADIVITDDGIGTNHLSLSGPDAGSFEIDGFELFLKAGVMLDFEDPMFNSYSVNVDVDDPSVGINPDDSTNLTLNITNINEPITDITLTEMSFDLDTLGDALGTLMVFDADGNNTAALSLLEELINGVQAMDMAMMPIFRLEIDGGALKLKDGEQFDSSVDKTLSVKVMADDGEGSTRTEAFHKVLSTGGLPFFSANFDVSTLDGSNGFVIKGINKFDFSGYSVSHAGDINDDGITDLIVGAPGAEGTAAESGESYVIFGRDTPFAASIDLSTFIGGSGAEGYAIFNIDLVNVNSGDMLGFTVSNAGDVNHDGIDDFILGAPNADPGSNVDAGESYVVFGGAGVGATGAFDLFTLNGANGFVINGATAGDLAGRSVGSAGDVNGDGIDDILISAPAAEPFGTLSGEAYVVYGKDTAMDGNFAASLDLSTLNGSNGFKISGIETAAELGWHIHGAGDINNDGLQDLIIGAPSSSPSIPLMSAGRSYVIFGNDGGFGASFDLTTLDGTNGFVIDGLNANDNLGYSVSSAGDVNGDGIDDLIVSAPGAGNGTSYVIFGKDTAMAGDFLTHFDLSTLNGSNGFALTTGIGFTASGTSVSSAGDITGDGYDDLIIGAEEGTVVVYGASSFAATVDLTLLDGTNGFMVDGLVPNFSLSGAFVSQAGDVNDDGIDDLMIGVRDAISDPENVSGTIQAGETYVIFGQTAFAVNTFMGMNTIQDNFIYHAGDDKVIISQFEDGLDLVDLTLNTGLTFADLDFTDNGMGGTLITSSLFDPFDQIEVLDVSPGSLSSDDFIFS